MLHGCGMKNATLYENMAIATRRGEILLLEILLGAADYAYQSLGNFIGKIDRIYLDKVSKGQELPGDFMMPDYVPSIHKK